MNVRIESMLENAQATRTRLHFIATVLKSGDGGGQVLDYGCGTGEHLTRYLGELFPQYEVTGVDPDQESIRFARETFIGIENLSFATHLPPGKQFDCIIASEVLEHVENPFEILMQLRSRLKKDAHLILTVPNGYGPSEWMSFIEAILTLSGCMRGVRRLKGRLVGKRGNEGRKTPDTLAVSPHINFFEFNKLRRIYNLCGLEQVRYRGRMLLYDLISSRVFNRFESLAVLNARMAGCLPPFMVSDWMIVLRKGPAVPLAGKIPVYRRNHFERLRRHINIRRWRDTESTGGVVACVE
ncbi:MAG: class I SAM-dependent methyltransferase [Pseudomonadota bacterium]